MCCFFPAFLLKTRLIILVFFLVYSVFWLFSANLTNLTCFPVVALIFSVVKLTFSGKISITGFVFPGWSCLSFSKEMLIYCRVSHFCFSNMEIIYFTETVMQGEESFFVWIFFTQTLVYSWFLLLLHHSSVFRCFFSSFSGP